MNGIFIHLTESNQRSYLTGVATDSHRLSSSSIPLEKTQDFVPFILPKKAVWITSTLSRSIYTAEKIQKKMQENFKIIKEKNFSEQNFGEWELKKWKDILRKKGKNFWNSFAYQKS